jgi:hypothetical protein
VELGVEDLDVRRQLDVGRGDLGRASDVEADRDRLVARAREDQVLHVEDDVGDVLGHALQGRELVERLVEAHLRDGRTGDGRQQRAAQRVAEGVAEARLERADGEPLAVGAGFLQGLDRRALDDQHGELFSSRAGPGPCAE